MSESISVDNLNEHMVIKVSESWKCFYTEINSCFILFWLKCKMGRNDENYCVNHSRNNLCLINLIHMMGISKYIIYYYSLRSKTHHKSERGVLFQKKKVCVCVCVCMKYYSFRNVINLWKFIIFKIKMYIRAKDIIGSNIIHTLCYVWMHIPIYILDTNTVLYICKLKTNQVIKNVTSLNVFICSHIPYASL